MLARTLCNVLQHSESCVDVQVSVYLYEDLPTELVGRGKVLRVVIDWLGEQQISKHLLEVCGHVPLLDHAAVVLDGQDDRIPTHTSRCLRCSWNIICVLFVFNRY